MAWLLGRGAHVALIVATAIYVAVTLLRLL
jgi:hypothetical protein